MLELEVELASLYLSYLILAIGFRTQFYLGIFFSKTASIEGSMNTDTQSHNRSVSLMKSETHDEIPQPKPMNVERIVEEAQNFEFNPLIPLKYWLRTASTLLKEVYS